jgi:hypothetical protein
MFVFRSRTLIVLCLLAAMPVASLLAQLTSADIVGRVTDSSGAVIAGAKVTAQNVDTHAARAVATNTSGEFVFTLLPIGNYTVEVKADGFKTFTEPGLRLASGDRQRVDAQMVVGQIAQTLEVNSQAAVLQTDSSTVGNTVTEKAVQDLPLNGRNYINLAQLAPGANAGSSTAFTSGTRPDDRRPNQTISVGAQGSQVNNFMVDGMDNNDREIGTVIVRPSVDALAEVSVQTNLYTAEVGRAAGGVVNLITKSGTNAVHGTLYEYFRNDDMDAAPFRFVASQPKAEYRLNQYGGSAGGPIKKDETFFFFDYEEVSLRQGQPATVTVPTAAEKAGDFSALLPKTVIYDPATLTTTGGVSTRAPFSQNIIPTSRINPIAADFMQLYQAPQTSGLTSNFASAYPKIQDSGTFDTKIDHRFNEKDYMFGRYSYNDTSTFIPGDQGIVVPGIYSGGSAISYPGASRERAQGLQLNEVHVFRPNLLLELKGGWVRWANHVAPINDGKNIASQFGIPGANHDAASTGLTNVTVSGYDGLGDSQWVPLITIDNTFQYQGSLTWTLGAHTLKFGAGLIRRQFLEYQSQNPKGLWSFGTAPTSSTLSVGGNGLSSFLLGIPTAASLNQALNWPGFRTWEPSAYAQDDWRVNSHLTLNLGLRYEIFTPFTEAHNEISNLDLSTMTVRTAGQNGFSSTAGVKTYYTNFSPRFGFAATFKRNLVVRGGFGLTYIPGQYMSQANFANPPWIATWSPIITANVPVNQTYNISSGFPAPVAQDPATLNTTVGGATLMATEFNLKPTYVQQFNLTVQKQLAGSVFGVGYVGSLTRHNALFPSNIDQPLPNVPSVNVQLTRPYYSQLPGVSTISYITDSGTINYHSMQATFEHRYAHGFSLNANYTLAHALQSGGQGQLINNWNLEYGNSPLDVRHRVTVAANYELPFGKASTGAMKQLIHGWQLNTIYYWQTGLPYSVTDLSAQTNLGITERPNRIASGQLANPTLNKWFDTSAFMVQPLGQIGNSGPYILYGPHLWSLNASMFKNFQIRESMQLQFRTEAYNLTNSPSFGNPNAQLGNASFGVISSMNGGYNPRQLQLALKLLF